VESLRIRVRDEYLNEPQFHDFAAARQILEEQGLGFQDPRPPKSRNDWDRRMRRGYRVALPRARC